MIGRAIFIIKGETPVVRTDVHAHVLPRDPEGDVQVGVGVLVHNPDIAATLLRGPEDDGALAAAILESSLLKIEPVQVLVHALEAGVRRPVRILLVRILRHRDAGNPGAVGGEVMDGQSQQRPLGDVQPVRHGEGDGGLHALPEHVVRAVVLAVDRLPQAVFVRGHVAVRVAEQLDAQAQRVKDAVSVGARVRIDMFDEVFVRVNGHRTRDAPPVAASH